MKIFCEFCELFKYFDLPEMRNINNILLAIHSMLLSKAYHY